MFPKTFIDKIECMQSLVGIRTGCSVDEQHPFWIEDIEGVDVKKLAGLTKASNSSGKDFANQLINNAARQMMGDIETLISDGYRLNNIIGDMCSTCSLLPTYTANSGIIAKPAVATKYGIMRINKLSILTNVTGDRQIKIDDGINPQFFNVSLIADTLMPFNLSYSTTQKFAKISFTDPAVGLGLVSCATQSGCGCGGSSKANSPVILTGMLNGIETSTQYGFIPCVAIDCSYDTLICNLIHQTPNIFGLALLYKTGELYYDNRNLSDRNNDSVAFNEGEEKIDQKNHYARRYWAKMKGTAGVNGINYIISNYLRNNRGDKCVVCDAKIKTAYVTG